MNTPDLKEISRRELLKDNARKGDFLLLHLRHDKSILRKEYITASFNFILRVSKVQETSLPGCKYLVLEPKCETADKITGRALLDFGLKTLLFSIP